MKKLWEMVNRLNVKEGTKNSLFLSALVGLACLAGCLVWVLLGRLMVPGAEGLVCFAGYPAVFIGFVGGIMYLYRRTLA